MAHKTDKDILKSVWENLPKSPDENHVTLTQGDIEVLWDTGFVDTDQCSREKWLNAFEPHKKEEDQYILSREDFFEKDKYRYKGEIMIPFQPLLINEGKYTDEGLQELVDMSITPSCSKTRKELNDFFEDFKDRYRDKDDNLIVMDLVSKKEIVELIGENPSPMRRRELLFDSLFDETIKEIESGEYKVTQATPEQAAQVQMTTFTTLPSSQTEKAGKGLKSLEKAEAPKATGGGDEGVDVKKVKKSRKGFRG